MRDQLILMDLWHYVEADEPPSPATLAAGTPAEENLNAPVAPPTPEEARKSRTGNLKAVAAIRNRLGCNGRDLLKDETNATRAWQILKESFSPCGSGVLNGLLIKLWTTTLATSQDATDYARRFKKALQDIRGMTTEVPINDNILILYFHLGLGAEYEQYREHYAQTHDIVPAGPNPAMGINYAINRFLNTCANRSAPAESAVIMAATANTPSLAAPGTKDVATIQVKHCTHCGRNYHVESECRDKHPHLKRDRDQSGRGGRGGRGNKRRRGNGNGNGSGNGARGGDGEDAEGSHKLYIAMTPETLSAMSAMPAHTTFWALDSACSQHSIREKSAFTSYTAFSKPIPVSGLGGSAAAMGQGTVRLSCKVGNRRVDISFSDAFYVPECPLNLISFGQLDGIRCPMSYKPGLFTVGDQGIIAKKRANNVFFFELWEHVSYNSITTPIADNPAATPAESPAESPTKLPAKSPAESSPAVNKETLSIWHARLGHLGEQNVRRLAKMSDGMDLTKPVADKNPCEPCTVAKQKAEPHNSPVVPGKHPLDLVWSDLVQPPVPNDKAKYFVTFLCDFTKRSVVYVLRAKSGTFDAFRHFQQHNEHGDNRVRRLRTDWGGEYSSDEFDKHRFEHGIEWEPTVPGTPEQNGAAERLGQTLMSMTSTMLKDAGLDDKWWTELVKTANYLRNRSPVANRPITPFEADTGRKPSLAHLRRIGTTGYAMERKPATGWKKLAPRSFPAVLVGYEGDHIYRMLRPNGTIYRASSVIWTKEKREEPSLLIPETSAKRPATDSVIPPAKRQALEPNPITILMPPPQPSQSATAVPPSPILSTGGVNTPSTESTPSTPPALSALDRHPELRYRLGSPDPLGLLVMGCMKNATDPQQTLEPRSYKEAMDDPSREEWVKAMEDENNSLLTNETWTLVNPPRDRRVLRGKWVYKIKRGGHGEILRHKARWVVRGFEQVEGLDYTETFASVVKPMSYKAMYAIAAANDWEIEQMDVKTAFLYGKILEDVYVVQPTGFEQGINQVCKLNKALYGLKQSPRVWFETLAKFLSSLGYVPLDAESNVFMKDGTMVAIYVDDLILTGPNPAAISWLKNALNGRFEMSDLGPCTYYLGMMISRNRSLRQLTLDQSTYVEQVLRDHGMWDCKPLATPMDASCRLVKAPDEYTADKSLRISYQSAVGSLMYIMLGTRPDIAYSISVVSRYASNPTQTHWQAVKRIFRYLRGTHQMKLVFRGALKPLEGYTDSDWAGDQDTRRSTSGYAFNVGSGVISWSSKRQPTVALSTCEAEYTGQTLAAKEAIWLRNLMAQLTCDAEYPQAVVIYGDNQGAIALAKNPQFHARTKHIDIQTHFIREKVAEGSIDLAYVPTDQMIADGLTKPLARDKFVQFRAALGIE